MITQERTLTGLPCAIRTAKSKKYNVKLCPSFDISTARIRDGSSSSIAPIAQTKRPDSCIRSVSAQLQHDEVKSCSNHAAQHQDRVVVDHHELRNCKRRDRLHLHTPAAWRRRRPNCDSSSSCVEVAATISTCMALGQLHPGTDSSKIAPQKFSLAASSVAQTGSAATTGAATTLHLPRKMRQCGTRHHRTLRTQEHPRL